MGKIREFFVVTPAEEEKVREVYKKSKGDVREDIKILKEWISKQKHLPQDQDDGRLERFLVRNKFRLEQTKKKLDNYYTLKGRHSEFFRDMDLTSPSLKKNLETFCWTPLKKLTHNQQRVFFCKLMNTEVDNFELLPAITRMFTTLEICLVQDYCVGDIVLVDGSGAALGHLLKFDPSLLGKLVQLHQEAYSGRFGGAHIVNAPGAIDVLIKVFRAVMPEKVFSKVKIHKSFDTLYEYVPKECLPAEYGGYDKPIAELHNEWISELEVQSDWLKQVVHITSNERLRVGKAPASELFGTEGSFRKLNID